MNARELPVIASTALRHRAVAAFRAQPREQLGGLLLAGGTVVAGFVLVGALRGGPDFLILALMLLVMVVIGVPALLYGLMFKRRAARAAVTAFLREGFCPSCAYHLRSLAPDPDGRTVCPECGAAWLFPDHPQSASQPS
jgi:hypothetical protein